jgi:hypothetical protein
LLQRRKAAQIASDGDDASASTELDCRIAYGNVSAPLGGVIDLSPAGDSLRPCVDQQLVDLLAAVGHDRLRPGLPDPA